MIRALSILLLLAEPAIAGEETERELDRIAEAIDRDLAFDEGIEVLSRLLERSELTLEERIEAYALSAVCHAARGDPEKAESAYFSLLMLAPDYAPEEWRSPKVKSSFARAQARWRRIAPELALEAPAVIEGRLRISATLTDPEELVRKVVLFARGEHGYVEHPFVRTERGFRVELPLAPRLEYFAIARGSAEQTLAQSGGGDRPLVHTTAIAPAPPEPISEAWFQKWWLWTAVAVVVAGSAIAVGVAATARDDELFSIRLPRE